MSEHQRRERALPAWPAPMGECDITKDAVVERLCDLLSLVWDRYEPKAENANDCFCSKNAHRNPRDFRFAQQSLVWLENLVRQTLGDSSAGEPVPVPTASDVENAAFKAGWDDAIEHVKEMLDERLTSRRPLRRPPPSSSTEKP